MKYYLAPMEGITTYIYRNAYARYYGGIDKYFTPFLGSRKMNAKELREIHPDNNHSLCVIPQILTNRSDEFLAIAERLADFGYREVNLNLGCPSGTVTAKNRGAGFLSVPDRLDAFLDAIYEKCPLKISIKTRLGYASLGEWEPLLQIYAKYPVSELIVHTRLREEFYAGPTHPECFRTACEILKDTPLCYNGDITTQKNLSSLDFCDTVMIGRGILKNPELLCPKDKETLYDFHNEILAGYCSIMSGDSPVLFKMKDLWTYMSSSFTDAEPYLKKIRKANRLSEYRIIVDALFREQALKYNH